MKFAVVLSFISAIIDGSARFAEPVGRGAWP